MTKIDRCINKAKNRLDRLGFPTVSDINAAVKSGDIADIINLCEIYHEQRISEIAETIHGDVKIRLVLISGPSGSGKTSFAAKLRLHLRVLGTDAVSISLDDYFKNIEDMPIGADGKYDFESFESIDYPLLNRHIGELIRGREVSMPIFDFNSDGSVPNARRLQLKENEIIIIEGIHALNEKIAENISGEQKFRVYCSALNALETDEGNRIRSSSTRLMRRLVRDFYFRNTKADFTFELWPNVEKSAEVNIYPYTDSADKIFNSSIPYEYSVYKKHLERVFDNIVLCEEHEKLKNEVMSIVDKFYVTDESKVWQTSIIREFIGGSTLF